MSTQAIHDSAAIGFEEGVSEEAIRRLCYVCGEFRTDVFLSVGLGLSVCSTCFNETPQPETSVLRTSLPTEAQADQYTTTGTYVPDPAGWL